MYVSIEMSEHWNKQAPMMQISRLQMLQSVGHQALQTQQEHSRESLEV